MKAETGILMTLNIVVSEHSSDKNNIKIIYRIYSAIRWGFPSLE